MVTEYPYPSRRTVLSQSTQEAHPWRTTARTVVQALIGLAAMAPLIYTAITQHEPASAVGAAATALAISGAVTRVMAVPAVNAWIARFVPWLAADGPKS